MTGSAPKPSEGFSADTEILTDSGFKLFAELDQTEAVAAVNIASDKIEFQRPTIYTDIFYDGEMIALRGLRIDALVMPDQRMFTVSNRSILERSERPLVKLARNLKRGQALKSRAQWIGTSAPLFLRECVSEEGRLLAGEKTLDRGDLAEFIGWHVTAGTSCLAGTNGSAWTAIYQGDFGKGKKLGALRELLRKLPWEFREVFRNDRCICFDSMDRQLYDLVQECGRGSVNKRIPRWVLLSSPSVLERFFKGCVHGHRFENQYGHRSIVTESRHLADGLQECLVKMGMGTTMKTIQFAEELQFHDHVLKAGLLYHVNEIRTLYTWLRGADADGGSIIHREFYSGRVYNLMVRSSILICRRNLKVFLAGSSSERNTH
jgi:hypothetical protein